MHWRQLWCRAGKYHTRQEFPVCKIAVTRLLSDSIPKKKAASRVVFKMELAPFLLRRATRGNEMVKHDIASDACCCVIQTVATQLPFVVQTSVHYATEEGERCSRKGSVYRKIAVVERAHDDNRVPIPVTTNITQQVRAFHVIKSILQGKSCVVVVHKALPAQTMRCRIYSARLRTAHALV